MPQLRQDIFEFSDSIPAGGLLVSQHNTNAASQVTTIDIVGVAPGIYDLELRSQSGTASRVANTDATSGQASMDAPPAVPLVDISGSVVPANPGPLPSRLTVRLASQQDAEPSVAQIEANGSFHLQAIRKGIYTVSAAANGVAVALRQLTASGGLVSGHQLKIGSEPVELRATVAENSASIKGFARDNGKPAAGVFILLVPDDPTTGPESWRLGQSDTDGSFEIAHVLAGKCTLLAIQKGWKLNWAHPHTIDRYAEKRVKVSVPSQGSEIILRNPLEVQSE